MTDVERAAILEKGKKCRARGCKCLARCFYVWNRYWKDKADICTHPNWCPADGEWWGDQPPFVISPERSEPRSGRYAGCNKQKPRQPVETKNYKQGSLI